MSDNKPSPLTIVPASAGFGKTHFIQEKLAEWVGTSGNGNAPVKIFAFTFRRSCCR